MHTEGDRMKVQYQYQTDLGMLYIVQEDDAIAEVGILQQNQIIPYEEQETSLIQNAYQQLKEYFQGERQTFQLPLAPKGTPFQQKVWNTLQTIPYGKTWSYLQMAKAIGNPKACRAVGMANHRNPIGIIIPCHRVIGSNGDLVRLCQRTRYETIFIEFRKRNVVKTKKEIRY